MAAQNLGGSLKAEINRRDGATYVTLAGDITEAADLSPLTKQGSPVVVDLAGIRRINSLGVRTWVLFVRQAETSGIDLYFERCAPVIVGQMSMIRHFMGAKSQVRTLFAPYLCESCGTEHLELIQVSPGQKLAVPPTVVCPK